MVKLIKALITAACVAGFDETTLRRGPAGTKKYVLAALTELYSLFFPAARSLESFRESGILPAFARGGGTGPLPELLPRRLAAHQRSSSLPGSPDQGSSGRR